MISPDPHWNAYNRIYGDDPSRIIPDIYAMRQSANLYAYVMSNPIRFTDPTGNLTPAQYPEFLWHFAGEGLEITWRNLSEFGISGIIDKVGGVISAGRGLASGEFELNDLISAMGQSVWDGLSGDIRYLMDNYYLFDPCRKLSENEV